MVNTNDRVAKFRKRISGRVVAGALLIFLGIGLILYPYMTDWRYTQFQKHVRAATKIKRSTPKSGRSKKPVAARKPSRTPTKLSGAIANLVIPKIALDTYVVEGTDQTALSVGPGHYEETPLPTQGGNTAIAGHRTMYGHPFRNLDQLVNGDEIKLIIGEKVFKYRVSEVKYVSPKDVSVVNPSKDDKLTLTTCAPVGSAKQRLIVIAKP